MRRTNSTRLRKIILPSWLVIGDTAFAFAGLALGYWTRYHTPLGRIGVDVPNAIFSNYIPVLLLGVVFLIAGYAQLGLYEERLLLRKYQSFALVVKGTTLWLAAYLALALVIKIDPPISRLFVPLAYICVLLVMYAWRSAFYAILIHPRWRERVRQRVAILGWNEDARSLAADMQSQPAHPYRFCGVIADPDDAAPDTIIGDLDTLAETLREHQIDVLISARIDLPRDQLAQVMDACERTYVEWKVIPSTFEIFLSGLRLQTVGRLPVLGIEDLAINKLFNRAMKRFIDIVGASIGLALSAPIMAVLAVLIKRESPTGPIFFAQTRVGSGHRNFTLWKLRSMVPDAAKSDGHRQSTARDDERMLRVGAVMRRWNLDELPQFWNVLRGDMSLVGPRPERPYHVDRLSTEIPHYLPRHLAKPGMSGWAQVNGLRGDSSIALRIQHDIYYIENWSLWFDLQILLLTFVRWKNAY